MKKPLLANALCASFLLLSCAGGPPPAPPPEWVDNIEAVYPNSTFLAEKGHGASKEAARIDASTRIARYISTEVENKMRETATLTTGSGTVTTTGEETFVKSQVELFAFGYSEPWYNRGEKTWEVAAYIDRDEAWKIYEPRLRREELAFLDIYNGAEKETDPIRRFALYSGAQTFYRQNLEPLRIFAEKLHPEAAAAGFAGTDTLLAELPRKADAARGSAVIFINCPNDFENRVTQVFEKHINAEGIRVTKNRAEATGIFAITIDDNQSTQKEGDITMYIFNPSLQAALNGKSGVLFSYNPPKIERSVAVNRDVGKRRAYQALAVSVEQSFPAEFRNRLASFAQVR